MSAKPSKKFIAVSPEAQFVRALQETPVPQRAFVIPNYAADPPEDDPVNLWMRYDGRLRGRFWNGASYTYVDYPMRTDITSPPAVPAYPARPAQPGAPITYSKSYTAQWTQGYRGDNTKRPDSVGDVMLPFGNSGDGNGTQKSLIGFDYATMATDLASSTVKSVQLSMTNIDAYWDSGVTIFFSIHNQTAEPSTWPALIQRFVNNRHFAKPERLNIALPIIFATGVRDGTGKGIALEAPSDSPDFYGYAAGVGSGYDPPILTVTYAK